MSKHWFKFNKQNKRRKIIIVSIVLLLVCGGFFVRHYDKIFKPQWEIVDKLDGNIFPSIVLSLASTNHIVIEPVSPEALGNRKSTFAIKIENPAEDSKVRIQLNRSNFYSSTTTEFELKEKGKTYYLYPNIVWRYDNLLTNEQPIPLDVSFQVFVNNEDFGSDSRTFSVRGINECLLGYKDNKGKYHDTGIFFAAYVNEDHPDIDKVLREALDTRMVKLFQGYQAKNPEDVKKQVYAIWYTLQRRNFKYSSISKTSLASDKLFSQRVRTVGNSLESSQINCLDGSVLFASFLRAINIDPIIVRIPGHVFVGFYLDKNHTERVFLETTFIGQLNLEDYLSQEQVEEALVYEELPEDELEENQEVDAENVEEIAAVLEVEKTEKKPLTQNEASKKTFDLAIEYATKKFEEHEQFFGTNKPNYMYLQINDDTRKIIQPIGK